MKYCLDCELPKSNKGKYCKKCGYKHRVRPKGLIYVIRIRNKGWFVNKGGWIDESGYRKIRVGKRQVREHVYVMEQNIGRRLEKHEVVHHVNGNKTDNRIENLRLMTKIDHDNLHRGRRLCL